MTDHTKFPIIIAYQEIESANALNELNALVDSSTNEQSLNLSSIFRIALPKIS